MEKDAIILKLESILANTLHHNNFEITDDLTAKDVDGWDSLSHMIIISEIEKDFGITFKLRDLNKLNNVGALIDVIQAKL
ncbi:acyl carrier protein [Mariniflexile ostreae]|uniref:Acyl carrier protein n=1 Tax=Mariniflexile ostreae TaxID=1520892 RepID=A0ABV5FDS3_9FLAO